ncbi:molybdenum cofactor guanylyltransferase [Paenibacillus thalictri]|uniref:Molybdenum cofactor guanylyltransferase n=1 Tax=Paenibacillus thalictri TaxID=2527873 RepID=A0A4V2J475_9BACL|nr:molybdenum cofactor guanylyltransferase [Paenibacillus thalictri]TBL78228.1 molybdenum cofactor guanylyltransferase [Paenibacillus thalictri]
MLSGVLLAGGDNRQMNGAVKALLPFGGETVIQKQIREMQKLCSEIIVVTNEPMMFLPVLDRSIRIITDYLPGKGPLGGMHAAFMLAKHDDLWIAGGNMPFISAKAGRLLWEHRKYFSYDAAVPVIAGQPCPLHAVYHHSCGEVVADMFAKGETRLPDMLQKIAWGGVSESFLNEQQVDSQFAFAIGSKDDYTLALQMAARQERTRDTAGT